MVGRQFSWTPTYTCGVPRWLIAFGAALVLAACGGGSTSSQVPAPSSTTTTSASTPTTSTVGTLGADADACALVTTDDAKSVLGELGAVPTPTASAAPGGVPGMLNATVCSYRASQAGDMSVLLAHFTDSAAAHNAVAQLLSLAAQGNPSFPQQSVSGLGDEAFSMMGQLPPPSSGTGFGVAVRKGAVAFVISGGVLTGHGPADVQGAVQALANKAVSKL